MFISKHHYAAELAKMDNIVYFMNAPEKGVGLKKGEIRIEKSEVDNVFVIKHKLFYPYILKFKTPAIHRYLLKIHLKNVYKKINRKVDIVWSFDVSDTIHLKSFPGRPLRIFMPVDNPHHPPEEERGDVMFSVTNEILDMYRCDTPKMFVNHGVAEYFINKVSPVKYGDNVQVGLSGNFLRPDIDWQCLLQIITNHPEVVFNFWGAFDLKEGNLSSDTEPAIVNYKNQLAGLTNVILHGPVKSDILAEGLKKMDAFLICYDIDKDQSKGTNYHKVLEYLAAGRVVVSNNITTYNDTGLIEMPEERNNTMLPQLFSDVINNLDKYNSTDKQTMRINYAQQHTYRGNIRTIEDFINKHYPVA